MGRRAGIVWLAGCTTLVVSAATGWWARAAIDNGRSWGTIPYRGHIEGDGGAVDVPIDLNLSLWDAPSGGAKLWEESQVNVPVRSGEFSVKLGEQTELNAAVARAIDLHLAVEVRRTGDTGAFTPLVGRQAIGSVPFALAAKRGMPGQPFAADGISVSGDAIVSGSVRGAGTTEIWTAQRDGGLGPRATGMLPIPGMGVTFTLARPATVHMIATGTIQLSNEGASVGRVCNVGLGFAVDGEVRGSPSRGQAVEDFVDSQTDSSITRRTWSISRNETLPAGAYVIDVRADDSESPGRCWVCANADGSIIDQRDCHLSVMAFYR